RAPDYAAATLRDARPRDTQISAAVHAVAQALRAGHEQRGRVLVEAGAAVRMLQALEAGRFDPRGAAIARHHGGAAVLPDCEPSFTRFGGVAGIDEIRKPGFAARGPARTRDEMPGVAAIDRL